NWAAMAQWVSVSSWAEFIPARNGWSATRTSIDSCSAPAVLLVSVFTIFLDEFVLFFSNDHDRAWRRTRYDFRGAANAKMFPTGKAMRCNNNEIDIHLPGCFEDFMRRDTGANRRPRPGHPGPRRGCRPCCQIFFRGRQFVLGEERHRRYSHKRGRRGFEHMKQSQLGAELFGEAQRVL